MIAAPRLPPGKDGIATGERQSTGPCRLVVARLAIGLQDPLALGWFGYRRLLRQQHRSRDQQGSGHEGTVKDYVHA